MNKNKMKIDKKIGISLLFIIMVSNIFNVFIIMAQDTHVYEAERFGKTHFVYGANQYSTNIMYIKNRYWVFGVETTSGHIWLYNSTDKQNWYGKEISTRIIYNTAGDHSYRCLHSVVDSNGDIHIGFLAQETPTHTYYHKIETLANGKINDLGENQLGVEGALNDLVVDGQDYPVRTYYDGSGYPRIQGSSTKDGTWTTDYDVRMTIDTQRGFGTLCPMSGNNGKDMIVIYTHHGAPDFEGYVIYHARYFHEVTETFSPEFDVDNGIRAISDKPQIMKANTLDVMFELNTTFISIMCRDYPGTDRKLYVYKTENGGQTWIKKQIYNPPDADTDYAGHILRLNQNKDLIMFYRHNDKYAGNTTFLYSKLLYIHQNKFQIAWNVEGQEIFNSADIYEGVYEGHTYWSITPSGKENVWSMTFSKNIHDAYTDECVHIYEGTLLPPITIPILFNVTIYNSDWSINDGWLFEGEVYHLVAYMAQVGYCHFNFTDTRHEVQFRFFNDTDVLTIKSDIDELVVGSVTTDYLHYREPLYNDSVKVQWTFILDINIIDSEQTWYWYANNTYGVTNIATSLDTNIYNLGGYVSYYFVGDGNRIAGGDAFEIEATNATLNSFAHAETIFRKLQHVHLLTELYTELDWNAVWERWEPNTGEGYFEFGIDYRLNEQWLTGWWCEIAINGANIGHHGVGADRAWIRFVVNWYNRDGASIKSDFVYAYNYAYFPAGDNTTTRHSSPFFIDLWFNRMNGSSVIGGRVTPYYLGVQEKGWWGFGDFRPMYSDTLSSMFFDDLLDSTKNVIDCQDIDLVRFWVNVTKFTEDDHTWRLQNYEILNWKLAPDRMSGVDTPIFVQPKMPEMPGQQGFLAPLYRAITGLSKAIWLGALGFIKVLWGAIDSFLMFIGFPAGTWSRIMAFFLAIPRIFMILLKNIGLIVDSIVDLASGMFPFITITIPRFLWLLMQIANSSISWWREIVNLFTGGWSGVRDLWALLDIGEWIILGISVIWPLWEFDRIVSAKDSIKKIKEDSEMYIGLYTRLFDFFRKIGEFIVNLVGLIRRLLPF